MKQNQFIEQRKPVWTQWEKLWEQYAQGNTIPIDQVGSVYRAICHDYAIASSRNYSIHLQQQLQAKVNEGQQLLYKEKRQWLFSFLRMLTTRFPIQLRNTPYLTVSMFSLFFLLLVIFALIGYLEPGFIYYLMPADAVQNMERMYNPDKLIQQQARLSDTDVYMFGFYIFNNVSIAFRTFVAGLFFGIGSLFFVCYNAVIIGAVAGYLTQLGFTHTFYPFVIGHGSVELTAIVIAGIAGLHLGKAIVEPGHQTRLDALKAGASTGLTLMFGATFFLVIAAFIEAFWSSSQSVSNPVKYTVGALLWLAVAVYLLRAGRRSEI